MFIAALFIIPKTRKDSIVTKTRKDNIMIYYIQWNKTQP